MLDLLDKLDRERTGEVRWQDHRLSIMNILFSQERKVDSHGLSEVIQRDNRKENNKKKRGELRRKSQSLKNSLEKTVTYQRPCKIIQKEQRYEHNKSSLISKTYFSYSYR